MTRDQAVKRLRRLYGARAYANVGEAQSSPDRRTEALQRAREARQRRDALEREIAARLEALDWYRELVAEKRKASEAASRELTNIGYYKFRVGQNRGFANEITGSGDTWEEALAAAEAKEKRP